MNREFEVLYEFMEKLPDALKAGIYSDYAKDVVRPSAQECAQNGRARSTKMRWAVKSEY